MSSLVNRKPNQPASASLKVQGAAIVNSALVDKIHTGNRVRDISVINSRVGVGEGLRVFISLMPLVGLFWVFIILRVHAIDGYLPYFVDELRHIERGRVVWGFSDIHTSTTPSKFLLYYWIGLLNLPQNLPGWEARTPVALFSLIGASGMFALAKLLFSKRVAYLSVIIILALPFMIFYERLALSDPLAAAFVVITAWWSVAYAQRPTVRKSIILGIMLCFMIAAKILTAPLVSLPIIAILLFSSQPLNVHEPIVPQLKAYFYAYWPTLKWAVIIVGIVWGIIMGFYAIRSAFYPGTTDPIVDRYLYEGLRRGIGVSDRTDPQKLWLRNIERLYEILMDLWGPILIGLGTISLPLLFKRFPLKVAYLLFTVALMWAVVILTAGQLSTRYMILPGHLLIVLLAAGIFALQNEISHYVSKSKYARYHAIAALIPFLFIGIWLAGFSAPFYGKLISNPENLNMPERDTYEYFENQTGYGIRDAMLAVSTMPSVSEGSEYPIIYGMVRNCHFLPNYIAADTPIEIRCSRQYHQWPRRDWPDSVERYTDVEALVAQYGEIYMMMEQFEEPMIDKWVLNAQMTLVKVFPRPYSGYPVNLYIVSSRDPVMSGQYVQP